MIDYELTRRSLDTFGNLRVNLAFATSFSRDSWIDQAKWDGSDLGFRHLAKGWTQPGAHNASIILLLLALMSQALTNYSELKRLLPRLEDPGVEGISDRLGDRRKVEMEMEMLRNSVFHVGGQGRPLDLGLLDRGGGPATVAQELLDALHDFARKVHDNEETLWQMGITLGAKELGRRTEELDRRAVAEGRMTFADYTKVYDEAAADFIDGKITPEAFARRTVLAAGV